MMKILQVMTTNSNYPLIIDTNALDKMAKYLIDAQITPNRKILLITDQHLEDLYGNKVRSLLKDYSVASFTVKPGENSKTLNQVDEIITFAIKNGLDRSSVVIALGGGMVGDLAGFVSAIYMRGIDFIQCPTTILAHDSSIGGKVGVNHSLGKNMIGAFHQPKLVIYDTALLKSLPKSEVKSGLAEVIKHGLIKDKDFVDWLSTYSEELLQLNPEYLNQALYIGSKIKADVVYQDEKELGIRAILNFGHTFGHVVEAISNYQYSHGEGVAIGMVYATKVANRLGMVTDDLVKQYIYLLKKFGLPTSIPKHYSANEMLAIMVRDKKFKQNQVRMILPTAVGSVEIVEGINKEILLEVMEEIKE